MTVIEKASATAENLPPNDLLVLGSNLVEVPAISHQETEKKPEIRLAEITFNCYGSDGVALQLKENADQQRRCNHQVFLCGGDVSESNLPELDYQSEENIDLQRRILNPDSNELADCGQALLVEIDEKSQVIKEKLRAFLEKNQINVAHIRNICSLPYLNLPASKAVYELIQEMPGLLFVLHHHDLSWEGPAAAHFNPPQEHSAIRALAEEVITPNFSNTRHIVINSIAAEALKKEKQVEAEIIPDGFNFDRQLIPIDQQKFREGLGLTENDLLVGMMTRVRINKSIELAIEIVAKLQECRQSFENASNGIGLNNRKFNQYSQIVLVIPQGKDLDTVYFAQLEAYAKNLGVNLRFIGEQVVSDTAYEVGCEKYPFYSTYQAMDLILYPPVHEGFGNQAIEAAWAKILLAMMGYPVAIRDIFPSNPAIISLGTPEQLEYTTEGLFAFKLEVIDQAIKEMIEVLTDSERLEAMIEENYHVFRDLCDIGNISQRYEEIYISGLEALKHDKV